MKRSVLSFWVLLIGVLVSAGQVFLLGPSLPGRVASHFGPGGVADGFMERGAFLVFQLTSTAVIVGLFLALPLLLRVLPAEGLNIPNKDHWLAPDRRGATISYLAERFFAFGAATLALFTAELQLVYEANLHGSASIGAASWVYVLLYLVYTAIWAGALARRFTRLPE